MFENAFEINRYLVAVKRLLATRINESNQRAAPKEAQSSQRRPTTAQQTLFKEEKVNHVNLDKSFKRLIFFLLIQFLNYLGNVILADQKLSNFWETFFKILLF